MRINITFLIVVLLFLSPCVIKSQTPEYFKIQNTAKIHASIDAKPKKALWGLAGFGSTLICGPIICGGITVAAAYVLTNTDAPVPLFRFKKMNNELSKQEFLLYSRTYSSEIVRTERKENVIGALLGIGSVFVLVIGGMILYIGAVLASS